MSLLDDALKGNQANETKPIAGNFTREEVVLIGVIMELGPYGQRSKLVHDCVMDGVSKLADAFDRKVLDATAVQVMATMAEKEAAAKAKAEKAAREAAKAPKK